MTIEGRTIFVTGANRGVGQALVEEALHRRAARVYAAARSPLRHDDARVIPITLDITNVQQINAAAAGVESLDILVNNAGVALYDKLDDAAVLERHLAVNLFGAYRVTQGLLPQLVKARGAVANVLSLAALAPLPMIPSYSISKAAAFSLSQSLRAHLAGRGVTVHAVLAGPVDTEMSRDLDVPKASPESVARAIFDGIDAGDDEIFPDPMSETIAASWRTGDLKALERQFAAFLDVAPIAS